MTRDTIIIVDTAQIQSYIFASNRLRENIGASDLVRRVTEEWARKHGNKHNAEEIYAAGGNYVALFEKADAKAFAKALSSQVIQDAPELQLVIGLHPFDANSNLKKCVDDAFKALAVQKQTRAPSAPLLGLGITVMCESTGFPATENTQIINGDPTSVYPASAGIIAKRKQLRAAKDNLHDSKDFQDILGKTFAFPSDFDEMGRSHGDQSLIAVVHADGNGIGSRIQALGKGKDVSEEEYKRLIGGFSRALDRATINALRDVLQSLIEKIKSVPGDNGKLIHRIVHHMTPFEGKPVDEGKRLLTQIVLRDAKPQDDKKLIGYTVDEIEQITAFERTRHYLPFIPIVYGGDDVTFVCDGRLGLSLAKLYLDRFRHYSASLNEFDKQGAATACAGIAIVKTHYPFARAYTLADDLCQNAKEYRRTLKDRNAGWDDCLLDWHYGISGLSGDIDTIRAREYTSQWQAKTIADPLERKKVSGEAIGNLTLRPFTLGPNPDPEKPTHTWSTLKAGMDEFQHEDWLSRRNKMKALREVLREGPTAVKRFLELYRLKEKGLPEVLEGYATLKDEGWQGDTCGYFDALELADLYVPVELKEAEVKA